MDIPLDLLSSLKCCICEGYLSCSPIYFDKDGKGSCGPCYNNAIVDLSKETNNEQTKIRIIQYEKLASLFKYPCRYGLFGCPEQFLFSDEGSRIHENSCTFKGIPCPMSSKDQNDKCTWRGALQKLLEHFEQNHPDNIEENLFSMVTNFTDNSVTNYLIPCFDTLFLLKITASQRSARAIFSLYLLDDSSEISDYSFNIDCQVNNSTVKTEYTIGTVDEFVKESLIYNIISKRTLLAKLGKLTLTDCNIIINIQPKSQIIKCKFCPREFKSAQKLYCENCESKLYLCKNNKKCSFVDINKHKVEKHEEYFCNKDFDSNDSVSWQFGEEWKAIPTPPRKLNSVLLRNKEVGEVLCKYYLDVRQFSIILCSTLSSEQLSLYKCVITVNENETGLYREVVLNHVQDFTWDWRFDIDLDRERVEETELDVNINLKKTVD